MLRAGSSTSTSDQEPPKASRGGSWLSYISSSLKALPGLAGSSIEEERPPDSPPDVEPPPSPPAVETTIESFNGTVTTPILLPVIIGIVVGVTGLCVCVVVVICIAVVCCLRKRRAHSAPSSAAAKYYQNRGPSVTVEKGTFEQGAIVTTNVTAVTSKI